MLYQWQLPVLMITLQLPALDNLYNFYSKYIVRQ